MKITPNLIAFLGLGKMADKMISRMSHAINSNELFHGFSPSQRKVNRVLTHPSIEKTLSHELKYIIYAFKPKNWDDNQRKTINKALKQNPHQPIIISVLAGLGIEELNCDIVTMPNVLCEVGHSFMFAHAKENLTKTQKLEFAKLFENMGPISWVNHPSKMHMAVASSGSAPAYVLFAMDKAIKMYELSGLSKLAARQKIVNLIKTTANFFKNKIKDENEINWEQCYQELTTNHQQIFVLRIIEAYCNAMHKLGLEMQTAYNVAWHTVLGTALLVEKHPELELISMMEDIMSKGGTTEKAISVAKTATFEIFNSEKNLNNFIFSILEAAYNQSIRLKEESKKKSSHLNVQSIFKTGTQEQLYSTQPELDLTKTR